MNRPDYIGGSDIAPILGLGHFSSRIDVYLQKLGIGDPVEENKAMKWGKKHEWEMLQLLAEEKGFYVLGHDRDGTLVVFSPDGGIHPAPEFKFPGNGIPLTMGDVKMLELVHPEFDYLAGHLDGIAYDENGIVVGFVDGKTSHFRRTHEWGDAGTDHIPQEYHFQFAHYGELLRLKLGRPVPCYVPVLIGGNDDRVYKVEYSEAMVADLYPILHEFWKMNVMAENPPDAEPTELGKKALSKLYPEDTGEVITADDQMTVEVECLKVAEVEAKEADGVKTACQNRIKDRMGDASRLEGNGWHLTWKTSKDSVKVDWEGVARGMAKVLEFGDQTLEAQTEEHTTTKTGARPFLTTGLKGLEV